MKNIASSGYVALSIVLVMLAVIIVLTLTMTYSAIGEAQSGLVLYQGEENLYGVEGCVEDAMLKIRSNSVQITSISRPEGVCTISYALGGPTNWDMTVTFQSSVSTNIQRKIRVIYVRNPTGITLTSWNEI